MPREISTHGGCCIKLGVWLAHSSFSRSQTCLRQLIDPRRRLLAAGRESQVCGRASIALDLVGPGDRLLPSERNPCQRFHQDCTGDAMVYHRSPPARYCSSITSERLGAVAPADVQAQRCFSHTTTRIGSPSIRGPSDGRIALTTSQRLACPYVRTDDAGKA